jgi:lipid A 3-O-deacylase
MVIKLIYMKKIICISAAIFCFCILNVSFAQDENRNILATSKNQLGVTLGYGEAYPGFGNTHIRVRDVDIILKYGRFLTDELGESWYKGRHAIVVEVPGYYVTSPKTSVMTGINLLANWTFTNISKTVAPYIFAGGGMVYMSSTMPDMGSKLNGNYQGGAGLYYFLSKDIAVDFNVRYHHISNLGTSSPNSPLNSMKATIGISHFW